MLTIFVTNIITINKLSYKKNIFFDLSWPLIIFSQQ